jgi:hypothetical protein
VTVIDCIADVDPLQGDGDEQYGEMQQAHISLNQRVERIRKQGNWAISACQQVAAGWARNRGMKIDTANAHRATAQMLRESRKLAESMRT